MADDIPTVDGHFVGDGFCWLTSVEHNDTGGIVCVPAIVSVQRISFQVRVVMNFIFRSSKELIC